MALLQPERQAASAGLIQPASGYSVWEGHHFWPVAKAGQGCDEIKRLAVHDGYALLVQQPTQGASQQL